MDQLVELGYDTLAGHTESPRDAVTEARRAEALESDATWIADREQRR